ncbi:Lytic transglycosylase, catalytic [Salmonella enterica subsp. enterica serovar Typhimurium]|uniref:transglycosylase SLT domain-containing protein n=1 Tax=Salmonella enterica TaxID=28901 RepID=UPI0007790630|nr:transglycosylase SLT domain-containing protein [Salmonella enterica]KYF19658.1 Lytic transglycosylase, catalytic [Salmonella enterica subsp. enterica serovar Typhimurium]KYF24146.1 Lytic transglycosylase, catalytic [Salmonella enterica subsp. enterica serovar Typhimurium]KYI68132.1 Lytic transglycosylase, catalytic [Salmonella enterica subsp. enterica serovar Typhimurium]KYI71312.1 Lytic transglycosylase, catalytic [Salmonella enterica subsp. enterica serovar Typhimurium]KYI75507.1 Lytic tr
MPTVPTVAGRQVESRGVSTQGFQAFDQPNTSDALLSTGSQALDVFGQAKQRADVAMAQDASLQLTQTASDLMTNPQNGLLNLQGKNALGKGQEYTQLFDAKTQELAMQLPESARQGFMQQAQQQRIQFQMTAGRHEVAQVRQYEAGMQEGTLRALSQQALSPGMFAPALFNARDSIIAYGKAHGQSDEEIESNFVQWREQAANRASEAWYTPTYQQMMGPEGKIEVTDTSSESQLFSAMIWQESGGNQYGKDGSPLVSPKGAVGVAQVMEDTGPEAARLAGVEWDRDKWLNDPRYNAKLGQAYFGAQMKKYDNNPVLAVAAYNAGPGAVDSWIERFGDPRTGAISNEQFAAAIPYDETRNYVAKVTSSAPAIPGTATMENLINQPFWNAMSPQNKSAMMSKVAGMYDMQAAAGRVSLQTRMQDDLAKLEAGKPVNPISEREWLAVMPLQASPAERIQMRESFQQYQQAMTLQPVYQTIVQGSAQQGIAAVQSMAPQEDDPDFKFKQNLYATAQAKLNQVMKARESDPGSWLQTNSPVVKNAFEQYQNNQASGEYLVSRLEAEKDRLGINSKKVLPDVMVNNLIQQIDNNKESSVTAIQSVAQSFGKYSDQVMQQVQKSAYPALQVIMATNNPRAANALWQNRSIKTSELRGSFEKTDADSADSSWNDQAKDFAGTMVVQPGGTAVWNNFNEQGKRLTYTYMQRGMSPGDAAKQAYQDILGEQYQTNGTWRMPNNAGHDIRDVNDGANEYLKNLSADQIMPLIGDARLPDEVNREQSISRIRDNAQWVTNSDETGLTLMMNGLLINNAQGQPITVSFADLAKLGAGNRTTWNSLTKFVQTPVKYTPGQSKNYTVESQRDNLINIIQNGQQTGR